MTAVLIRDEDLTRPWVLLREGQEIFRASTRAICERHAMWKKIQVID